VAAQGKKEKGAAGAKTLSPSCGENVLGLAFERRRRLARAKDGVRARAERHGGRAGPGGAGRVVEEIDSEGEEMPERRREWIRASGPDTDRLFALSVPQPRHLLAELGQIESFVASPG
jgi:hypothetical protein